ADRIGDVDLAAFERRQPRRLFGDYLEDQPLHIGRLSPVLVKRLEYELDAGSERDELVRPGADRRVLEALVTDLFDVSPRHDPARGGGGRVKCQKIRPRFF